MPPVSKSPRLPAAVRPDTRAAEIKKLRDRFLERLQQMQWRSLITATRNDLYLALAYLVRDELVARAVHTADAFIERGNLKMVAYLSAEFLMGPHLGNNLVALGCMDKINAALEAAGVSLDQLLDQEEEPGLGNGGLGRLAACFLDSLATLEVPAIGYGIRYEFGIFDQMIQNGWQVETTDKWLRLGNPWEIARPELAYPVRFGGTTRLMGDAKGNFTMQWVPERAVMGVAYDTPCPGYRVNTCNTLRLFKAEAVESFNFDAFNRGDYYGAVESKMASENISKVLYPNDEAIQGKRLRLEQQYFFVSCALQDMLRNLAKVGKTPDKFHEMFAVQLNDTHPSIGVAELMRLLVDEHKMPWEKAWDVTVKTFGYTNHTLLPEALEKWPLDIFRSLLPRHLDIIFEINRRFLDQIRLKFPDDAGKIARMSLIDEAGPRFVRMANLACVGSHAINGVAALHSDLLKETVLKDFAEMMPEKFSNKTNGVTPRRWMVLANPGMTDLITKAIGESWVTFTEHDLPKLEPLAEDPAFRKAWRSVKLANKERLATLIKDKTGIDVDPATLFDIQVKRIHEYKRQHLNLLGVITMYNRLRRNPNLKVAPRTILFGGKAAPGYRQAKLIIKLANSIAEVIAADPVVSQKLKLVYIPDFSVKLGHLIYPAADLSEQISTAGKEASGTGNMKFALNGALTIGTLDGANVEIRESVGADNFFLFGLTAAEVDRRRLDGYYPWRVYQDNPELREVIDQIAGGHFSSGDTSLFRPIVDSLLGHDEYMLFADYADYLRAQDEVDKAWFDQDRWTKMSILNVARSGKFSSDRTIREYCHDIWKVAPMPVDNDDDA
ncbi:MAG TPA: glycogen/starch/alpha-glucan phosphorylase [Phycisphaerae bacterium]|nr:glycogen/starch/alpha-glucan phosphorylase [Phycisphaerae bacterium]